LSLFRPFKHILQHSQEFSEISNAQYYLFTCFSILNHGLPFLFWSNLYAKQPMSIIFLHSAAAALSFVLIFKESVPEKVKPYFLFYWYFTLMFCLPFVSTCMMLKGMISFSWFFLLIFLLSILVNWIYFIIITLVGCLSALFLIGFSNSQLFLQSNDPTQTITAYTCALAILVISLFLRNRDHILQERIKAYEDLSGYIAHEIRKPLGFIRSGCEGWEQNCEMLFEAYDSAIKAGVYKNEINEVALNTLRKIPTEFKKTSTDGLLFIEMLLMQTRPSEIKKEFSFEYALDNINKVLERWNSGNDRVAKINLRTDYNFKYHGNDIMLNHVLLELCRNSEYFIGNKKYGQIDIWCARSGIYNEIHFKDNGCGIDYHDLPHVFRNGFSKRRYGTGIGLGFCKMVMRQMGGSIRMLSKKGEFAEAILSFPIPRGVKEDVA